MCVLCLTGCCWCLLYLPAWLCVITSYRQPWVWFSSPSRRDFCWAWISARLAHSAEVPGQPLGTVDFAEGGHHPLLPVLLAGVWAAGSCCYIWACYWWQWQRQGCCITSSAQLNPRARSLGLRLLSATSSSYYFASAGLSERSRGPMYLEECSSIPCTLKACPVCRLSSRGTEDYTSPQQSEESFFILVSLLWTDRQFSWDVKTTILWTNLFKTPFTVLFHSVSICNDCFPVYGQVSAAAPPGFTQCWIHTSL